MRGEPADLAAIAAEIAPCFVAVDGRRTDAVVLACTHYPLLADIFAEIAPWPVAWIDPAPAIARRVTQILGPAQPGHVPPPATALLTGGAALAGLATVFAGFGLGETRVESLPLH